ncbi:MAG: SpoIIE family protein phosphatase [Leptospiraceae bacterium]|nr:SpoIIE family protein phosphatase [Leptospiraceae bacterium]
MALINVFFEKPLSIKITEEYNVLFARNSIRNYAVSVGFEDSELEKIELVVSELGMNIVKYAKKGILKVSKISFLQYKGIEISALDDGPGFDNIIEKVEKKTPALIGESLGAGLYTIYHLMDEFQVNSQKSNHSMLGTEIIVRKWVDIPSFMKVSAISQPRLGENKNGDIFFIKTLPEYIFFSVIDALGHGDEAALVAKKAYNFLKIFFYLPLPTIIDELHKLLNNTRGAAISICKVIPVHQAIEYIGIGNVDFKVYGSEAKVKAYNYHGTLGMQIESNQHQTFSYNRGSTFIMYSDGIAEHRLEQAQLRLQTQNLANYIMDTYNKKHDDATILVLR